MSYSPIRCGLIYNRSSIAGNHECPSNFTMNSIICIQAGKINDLKAGDSHLLSFDRSGTDKPAHAGPDYSRSGEDCKKLGCECQRVTTKPPAFSILCIHISQRIRSSSTGSALEFSS